MEKSSMKAWNGWPLKIAGAGIILITVAIALQSIFASAYFFQSDCTSRDVLNWDANIRYVLVFDQYRAIIKGEFLKAALVFFEGSTWPPLYNAICLFLFLVWPGGPNPVVAILPSVFFYCALFPSIIWISIKLTDKIWKAGLISFIATVFLIHTAELQAYALSAMLEAQGMFFMLWTLFFMHSILQDSKDKYYKLFLFLAAAGLFLTKYPFGIMLAMAWGLLAVAMHALAFKEFFQLIWRRYFMSESALLRIVHFALPIATALAFILLLGMGFLGAGQINKKIYKYIIYVFAVLFLIDINVFLFRNRALIALPESIKTIYAFAFLPGIAWIFLHPDRFSGVIGGQFWIIKQTSSFFKSLLFDIFSAPALFSLLFALFILSFIMNWIYSKRKQQPFLDSPAVSITLIILLQILLQEVFSPNKQYRHIYYLIPSLLLFVGFWIAALNILHRNLFLRYVLVLFIFSLGFAQLTAEDGLWRNYRKRHFCYAGTDPTRYAPARNLAGMLDPDRNYIFVNRLHADPPGTLSLATEFDVLFRSRLSRKGSLVNDTRHLKTWGEANRLLELSRSCSSAVRPDLEELARHKAGARLILLREIEEEGHCLAEYSFTRP